MELGLSPAIETLLVFQLVLVIAAIGHYLPLSINQLDIAVPAYMAIGAYSSSFVSIRYGWPLVIVIVVAGVCAAVAALVIDLLAIRSGAQGFAFAIISLGFVQILQVLLNNSAPLGGAEGFRGIPAYTTLTSVIVVLLLVLVFVVVLRRSPTGLAMRAIRDDEGAAAAMGVSLVPTKLFVFASGAFIGGVAGSLYAHYALFIYPGYFGFPLLISINLPVVFGGLETVWGAIFGMLLLGFLPEFVRPLQGYRLIATAALTAAVVLLRPRGVVTEDMVGFVGRHTGRLAHEVASLPRRRTRDTHEEEDNS